MAGAGQAEGRVAVGSAAVAGALAGSVAVAVAGALVAVAAVVAMAGVLVAATDGDEMAGSGTESQKAGLISSCPLLSRCAGKVHNLLHLRFRWFHKKEL